MELHYITDRSFTGIALHHNTEYVKRKRKSVAEHISRVMALPFPVKAGGYWNYNDNCTIPQAEMLYLTSFSFPFFVLPAHRSAMRGGNIGINRARRQATGMEIAFPARGSANGLITSLDIFLDIAKSEWDRAWWVSCSCTFGYSLSFVIPDTNIYCK